MTPRLRRHRKLCNGHFLFYDTCILVPIHVSSLGYMYHPYDTCITRPIHVSRYMDYLWTILDAWTILDHPGAAFLHVPPQRSGPCRCPCWCPWRKCTACWCWAGRHDGICAHIIAVNVMLDMVDLDHLLTSLVRPHAEEECPHSHGRDRPGWGRCSLVLKIHDVCTRALLGLECIA